ncbi:hypothetical protein XENTR_v10007638 [Xenopus tropicalis]|nr:hypothetical protein XENTR_v10007638 [Xenopus tropicalis]
MWVSALRRWAPSAANAGVRSGPTVTPQRRLHDAPLRIHPRVQEALATREPVVALESTIITHGMPYPYNIRMAKEVEEIVKANGSVPATVGILQGRLHVGLCDEELQFLAQSKDCVKVSRRDLPYVLSQGLSGGSTVSGTMIAAHRAGIPVFVTGGVGGVHHEGEKTMDVSADLTELGRTPVAVISAGVKSILDIGRTLEYLETEGVCVSTFGDSTDFPAFFTPKSGFKAPCRGGSSKAYCSFIGAGAQQRHPIGRAHPCGARGPRERDRGGSSASSEGGQTSGGARKGSDPIPAAESE